VPALRRPGAISLLQVTDDALESLGVEAGAQEVEAEPLAIMARARQFDGLSVLRSRVPLQIAVRSQEWSSKRCRENAEYLLDVTVEQTEVAPDLPQGTVGRSDSKQSSQPDSQLREMVTEASHRILQPSPPGRLRTRRRRRIVQASLKFGCGDPSIRQHACFKNRDSGMATRATEALQPRFGAFSWRLPVPMHLVHSRARTTSWRQSADLSLSNLHAENKPNRRPTFERKFVG
jgi:hypothetical protein